jgi:hypothetical protein
VIAQALRGFVEKAERAAQGYEERRFQELATEDSNDVPRQIGFVGRRIAAAGDAGTIEVFETRAGKFVWLYQGIDDPEGTASDWGTCSTLTELLRSIHWDVLESEDVRQDLLNQLSANKGDEFWID